MRMIFSFRDGKEYIFHVTLVSASREKAEVGFLEGEGETEGYPVKDGIWVGSRGEWRRASARELLDV